ncbi:hypothetical protein JIN85_07875 [Luteolibacter pohnpeiensis]|uniref:Uncharacterized protein n=1 Tax=Luteolibacter pohnpeiensis TaxID=454153 RepID=A0A934S5N9_9BACT|nr:DUF6580 family putative transport protein [Luteolibacter pohnpeiensis]MBK1882328.1 hypothetical protein [Luteolibacter pohnpeiensis]
MHRWLPATLIVALLIGFRTLGSCFPEALPNLQPLPALLLCSLVFLHGVQKWLLPLVVWIITDPVTSLVQGYSPFGLHNISLVLGILIVLGVSTWNRRHPSTLATLGSAAVCAVAFHVLTGLVSFAFDPLYVKNWDGLLQSQWTSPPGYGPTWMFLRNLLVANLAFSGLFLAARSSLLKPSPEPLPSPAR